MNGITYFKLTSQYEGDVTKNCGLTGGEIDNNFHVLEGRDVKKVELEGTSLKVTLYNDDLLYADLSSLLNGALDTVSFDFDSENGVLTITKGGDVQQISGFLTTCSAYTDGSLKGDGTMGNPLGISSVYRTGVYRPVKGLISEAVDGSLPSDPSVGDRYLVAWSVNRYGRLFDYFGVQKIACALSENSDGWRVATKSDWDDMLNALEPLKDYRNHANPGGSIFLGKEAGDRLKAEGKWPERENVPDGGISHNVGGCAHQQNGCNPTYCGEHHHCCECCENSTCVPTTNYDFNAIPSGFADVNGRCGYFGEWAVFWTGTMVDDGRGAYFKQLQWDASTVYQGVAPTSMRYSVRLVKDYNGHNFSNTETIIDTTYNTVLMPSLEKGHRIWTASNFASPNQTFGGIVPCSAPDESSDEIYFIAEWDGCRWISSPFISGDSVVVNKIVYSEDKIRYNVEVRLYPVIGDDGEPTGEYELRSVSDTEEENIDYIGEITQNNSLRLDNLEETVYGQKKPQTDEERNGGLVGMTNELSNEVSEINGQISDIQETLNGDEDTGEKGLIQRVEDIEGAIGDANANMITGGEFNGENGVLTLKRGEGDENNIEIGFSFNFGDI